MLVRFRDVNDPKTVEQVHPHNLAERFGTSVKLIGATLEIVPAGSQLYCDTDEPITTGALERSAWPKRLNGGYLDGAFAGGGAALSNALHGGNFKTRP
jgi:hypothetical protein